MAIPLLQAQTDRQMSAGAEAIAHPHKPVTFNFNTVCVMNNVHLQIALCPLGKKEDIRYCLQHCAPGDGIIALVNGVRITATSAAPHLTRIKTVKQPDTSKESTPEPFLIRSDQVPQEPLDNTLLRDFLKGKIAPPKNKTEFDIKSQDPRIEKVYGPVINRHFKKLWSSRNPPDTINSGSIFARPTPGGMEMVDGIFHYCSECTNVRKFSVKPHQINHQSKMPVPPAAPSLSHLSPEKQTFTLMQLNSLIKQSSVHHSAQENSASNSNLITSLKAIFKGLSQRESYDLELRRKLEAAYQDTTAKPVTEKEKVLLFIENSKKILNHNYDDYLSSLYDALSNTHKDIKPSRILFLTTDENLEQTLRNTHLNTIHKELITAAGMLSTIYSKSISPAIKSRHSTIKEFCQQLKKNENQQQNIDKLLNSTDSLIRDCRFFYDNHLKIPSTSPSPPLEIELHRNTSHIIWNFLYSLTFLLLNTNEPMYFEKIIEFTTAALLSRPEIKQNKKIQCCVFQDNKSLINNLMELLFRKITVNFQDQEIFTKLTNLLRLFIEKKYLNPVIPNPYKVDTDVKLRIMDTFITKICEQYQKCKKLHPKPQDIKNLQQAINAVYSYAKNCRVISTCYSLVSEKQNDRLKPITEELESLHSNLVAKQFSEAPTPKKTKSKKKKK